MHSRLNGCAAQKRRPAILQPAAISRAHAFYKMVSLVRGANIVRHELGLPEADILATRQNLAFL